MIAVINPFTMKIELVFSPLNDFMWETMQECPEWTLVFVD